VSRLAHLKAYLIIVSSNKSPVSSITEKIRSELANASSSLTHDVISDKRIDAYENALIDLIEAGR
jgi:hypothetical protein